ncbi:DNA polymerase delta subunit 3 [Macrotis lagotis]|uniref:DNA polymerase delta subunit 3 n=1 Tax=Macrotis lagotis TaxID=92651 RepID=UPI003D69D500
MADQLYLENIDEFVTDQNKIVTYKWLSYTLGVHVNQAKQMLYDYVERKRKENSGAQLHVTYLVSGNLVQNGNSVSCCCEINRMLSCPRFSAIQCAAAVPRAPNEIFPSEKFGQTDLQASNETLPNGGPTTNGHGPPAAKQTSQHPKGIMGMFASKMASKPQDTNKETKTESKEATNTSSTSSKPPGKGNVMSNFFGKAAMNKLKVNLDSEQAVKEEKTLEQPPISVAEPKLACPGGLKKPYKKVEPVKIQQKEKKRGKRTELSDDEAKETENLKKKRRRIKLPESDSSEDEVVPDSPGAYEAESPPSGPPQSPLPEPAPKTEPEPSSIKITSGEKKRKRKRVLKSRTFQDEEGCIVTEKTYESESCTDSEEEFKVKTTSFQRPPSMTVKKEPKEERKGLKKGAAAPGKANRQVSITGFFQKK